MKNAASCLKKMNALPGLAEKALRQAQQESAQSAMENARQNVPVKTGRLHSSIALKQENFRTLVTAGAQYASIIETGTRRNPARPFLTPAARESGYEKKAAERLKEVLTK